MGHPTIKTDYVALLNRPTLETPLEQRAWPMYRQALLVLWPKDTSEQQQVYGLQEAKPGDEKYPQLIRWLEEHQQAIELVRQGAGRERLGLVYGPYGDSDVWPGRRVKGLSDPVPTPLVSVLLPHLSHVRFLATTLAADCRAGREQGDVSRVLSDLSALQGLADQVRDEPFIISHLVACAIRAMGLKQLRQTLQARPDMLPDQHWTELAHAWSRERATSDLFSLATERYFYYDLMQRTYSDDGNGDGRLTPEGLQFFSQIRPGHVGEEAVMLSVPSTAAAIATGPMPMLLWGSRREVMQEYDRLLDEAEARFHRPYRDADWPWFLNSIRRIDESYLQRTRFAMVRMMLPALSNLHRTGDLYLAERDGVLAGIALELYRRHHDGEYPRALDDLVPGYLPVVPADPFTGQPLHYRLVDGRLVVYSVGADRDDDGGRACGDERAVKDLAKSQSDAPDGDWVLFLGE